MIEFRSEYIYIQIEYTILGRGIVHIGIYLVLVLYAYHSTDKSTSYSGLYIIAYIAIEIGEFPCIILIF